MAKIEGDHPRRSDHGAAILAWLGLGLAVALLAGPACAEEPNTDNDEPVATFSATALVEQRELDSATAAVTMIDRRQILDSGATTVGELLRQVAGVFVTSTTRGGSTTAQLRGGDPNFTFVLLDGVPLNDPTGRQGGAYNLEALAVGSIERIEVVRGPLSSFYGSSGLGGAINIVTRSGAVAAGKEQIESTFEVASGEGSQRLFAASVAGPAGDGASYFVGLSAQRQSQLIAEESFEGADLLANLRFALGDHSSLKISARYADWQGTDYPESSGGPLLGSGELRDSDNSELTLGVRWLKRGRRDRQHRISASLHRHRLDRTSPSIGLLVPASREATRYSRSRLAWALSLPPTATRQVTVGLEVEREEAHTRGLLFLPPFLGGDAMSDYRAERTTPGLFAEVISHHAGFDIEAGLRIDGPWDQAVEFSPRLALSYRLKHGSTRLSASVARAFKLPSFFALASPPQLGGNPDLEPERVLSADLGLAQPFAGGEVRLRLFWNRYRDLVDFDFDLFTHLNRSRVGAQGIEAESSWQPSQKWIVRADVTYQEVEDLDSGERLLDRPRFHGGAQLSFHPTTRLRLQAELRSVASRLDRQIPVPSRSRAAGYRTMALSGSWRATSQWKVHGRLDNAADQEYETLIGFPGAGRTFRLAIRWAAQTRSPATEND